MKQQGQSKHACCATKTSSETQVKQGRTKKIQTKNHHQTYAQKEEENEKVTSKEQEEKEKVELRSSTTQWSNKERFRCSSICSFKDSNIKEDQTRIHE